MQLTAPQNRWQIFPRAPQEFFDHFPAIPRLVAQLMYNRGIFTPEDVTAFLDDTPISHDPFQLAGMAEAVAHIRAAIAAGERVAVYGDYDADGVTSTTLMVQALRALGATVQAYIPNRFNEGYGLNRQALAYLANEGIGLVVTVDCGIRSLAEVAYGNDLGLKIIVTDHHQVGKQADGRDALPPALAVVNPKREACPYPFKDLAGVGVAYKVVQALISVSGPEAAGHPHLQDDMMLDLVAIGTVADLVPLVGENRSIVKRGLKVVNHTRRPGLQALIEAARLNPGRIDASGIGFGIGPRLNAAGRLDDAKQAYRLLSTADPAEAESLAEALNELNIQRQTMTHDYVNLAKEQIGQSKTPEPLYLIAHPEFNEGVVGLVASRLTDELYRPTLVAHQGETLTRGSGRSIIEFDITRALDQCADLLVKYGGHAAAAGFTIENDKLDAFRARLSEIAGRSFEADALQKTIAIDAEINLRGVDFDLVQEIHSLQPFGYSNPTPLFVTRSLTVENQRLVGKDSSHLKLTLYDGKQNWPAIGFRMGAAWANLEKGDAIDAVYELDINEWNGQVSLQLLLRDIRLSEGETN